MASEVSYVASEHISEYAKLHSEASELNCAGPEFNSEAAELDTDASKLKFWSLRFSSEASVFSFEYVEIISEVSKLGSEAS